MIAALALTIVLTQPPAPVSRFEEVQPRYDVGALVKLYPQGTAKLALDSAIKAAEKGRFDYVAAHLLDPAYVDAEAANRGKAFLADAEADLRIRREQEKDRTDLPREKRLPAEPELFQPFIESEAKSRGFRRFVTDMREKAFDDPNAIRELRRFLREGTWEESGDTAKVTLRDVKDKAVYLKKVGQRWFVENKMEDAKPAGANP